jgi:hypothetical protein
MQSFQAPSRAAVRPRGARAGASRRAGAQAHAAGAPGGGSAPSRRAGRLNVASPASEPGAALTPSGVVPLDSAAAAAEQARLEGTDAFAELVKLSSLGGAAGQAPSAAKAFSAGGLKKPPWLRQRAPQGERCAPHARRRRPAAQRPCRAEKHAPEKRFMGFGR